MTEVQKYIEALKEITAFSKSLDKDIVVALVNQLGIDFRLKGNPTKPTETTKPEFIPATESQVQVLKKMNMFKEGLSKSDAWKLINDSKNKQQEY